jgi:primosomal protein N' (replication factor Y)
VTDTDGAPAEQLALLKSTVRARRPKPVSGVAAELPVAHVALEVPLAHLDRPFDYLVPESMSDQARPGCRVKVRFAGRDVDGFVLSRAETSGHDGRLTPLRRVVSSEPVLAPQVAALARHVADRYAGTVADVLRLAVPPRHARVEAEEPPEATALPLISAADLAPAWEREAGGPGLLDRLAGGGAPRAVWTAAPRADWSGQLAAAAAATASSGRGSLLCVPDARDVARLSTALTSLLGDGSHVTLTADLGPAARYRAFLAVSRGRVPIVVGTRAAAFAPVPQLGLVAIWDDGDDLYDEPRAPYPHTREVLLLRAFHERTAAVVGGWARSCEAQALVESGWAVEIAPPRSVMRAAAPQVHLTGESDAELARDVGATVARMPRVVFETVREALQLGPVLVHSPRGGYQPTLGCGDCRQPARCPACAGPLGRPDGGAPPRCRWCGRTVDPWTCPNCDGVRLRAPVVGALRTAEEWGRSFPRTSVAVSGGDRVLDRVDPEPAIVIATPGAEPTVEGGFAAAVILDTWLTLSMAGLRASEEALRRWFGVAARVRAGDAGGRVVAVGDPSLAALQALVRWDPVGFAARELDERRSARLTPAVRMATVTGAPELLTDALAAMELPRQAQVLGPVELDDGQARLVVRTDKSRGPGLTRALQHLQAGRSSRKLPPVRVQVDPFDLG